MCTKPSLQHRGLLLVSSVTLAGCGTFGSDGDRYEKLDRLRVLAVRSDPADLRVGETATLSAHVYEPEGREVGYEWSWCPSRADSAEAFACNISEEDLRRAWTEAGSEGSPPSYDLGTEPEARLTHVLTPSLVSALCEGSNLDERVQIACFAGLQASIQFRVRSFEEQLTAIKSVPLLLDGTADDARNENPPSDFGLTLRDQDGAAVEEDQPLRAGHRYTVIADLDGASAELFTPTALPGEPAPRERRETLVMTWFVTAGELVDPDGGDGIGDDFSRTTFVDGSNDIADLSKNGWKLPLTAGPRAALHLVLRDERGGAGFTTRSFDVAGGEP